MATALARPSPGIGLLQQCAHGVALGGGQRAQQGPAHGRVGQRQAGAHVQPQRQPAGAAAVGHVHHLQLMPQAHRHGGLHPVGDGLHHRPCDAGDVEVGQHAEAQRQHAARQRVLAGIGLVAQVAQVREREGQARHGGLRQAGAAGDLLV
ncbi:hypothetical protein [Aquincola sp. J276]|uniref:hypothetical protein n=1 Tax=Aquincola sp. J276 TaxID=2898432 RepID=UPI0021515C51|nr:hypothetical protein [Aquincola sp. J276]MCR5867976.1 hypothetical protein [Aquincola sp. J276]